MPLIRFTNKGLYCPPGDFYIDPWRGVDRALITHAHSDHSRWGSKHYLAHHLSRGMMLQRLGDISLQTIGWNETLDMNGVKVSFHPAGHILGSSQIRVEYKGEIWLITGDYKLEQDGISGNWEPVRCTHMVTECTFGLPIYQWKPQKQLFDEMRNWVLANNTAKKTSVFFAYSLGKAQRVMHALAPLGIPMFAHGAVYNANKALQTDGVELPEVLPVTGVEDKNTFAGSIVIAPPSAASTPWLRRFSQRSEANCSGWMQVRGNKRRNNVDEGFVLSDHADWPGLLTAIDLCKPEKVFPTHGFTEVFSRYLREEKGMYAQAVKTEYGQEDDEVVAEPKEDAA